MSDDDDSITYYLDCPFEEKDYAKALGAQFDGSERRWIVPAHHFPIIHRFNRWRPMGNRVYLNCPFSEKDQAKKAGAKWDPVVKAWYVTVPKSKQVPAKFKQWLSEDDPTPDFASSFASPAPKKPKAKAATKVKESPAAATASAVKKRGNAQDAATLRIGDGMTVGQLQDECRLRGIKGLSGKNKVWLLDILGAGSIWQTMSMAQVKEKSPAKKKSAPAAAKKVVVKKKETPTAKVKVASPKTKAAPVSVKPPLAKKAKATLKATPVAAKKVTKSAPPPAKKALKAMDWSTFPRVSSSLTAAQLMHELLHRQPGLKGTSNKSKPWFLEALGEHSIWTTSPDLPKKRIVAKQPRVSSSLTIAQLTHELMSRRSSSPDNAGTATKGLSGKSKMDLLKVVGADSVWTTAPPTETSATPAQKQAPVSVKKRPASAQKDVPAKSKSVSSKLEHAPAVSTVMPPKTASTSVPVSNIPQSSSTPGRIKKESKKGVAPAKVKKEAQLKSGRASSKIVPQLTSSSSCVASNVSTQKPVARVQSSVAAARKSVPVLALPPAVLTSVQIKRPAVATESTEKKKVKLESNSIPESSPVVSPKMTLSQLKEEFKARDPTLKGYSNKNKEWFLSQLSLGTELHSSIEFKEKQAVKAAQEKAKEDSAAAELHIHQYICHAHPLADSALLRPFKSGFVPFGKNPCRKFSATCDLEHDWICKERAYRTCELCNWDVCQPCFEIESLPTLSKREAELQKRQQQARRYEETFNHEAIFGREATFGSEEILFGYEVPTQPEPRISHHYRNEDSSDGEDDNLNKFPAKIQNPPSCNRQVSSKLKYTVWKRTNDPNEVPNGEKDFDSSFGTLKEANLRVEYLFYYDNPWELPKDEMYANEDKELQGGLRYMGSQSNHEGTLTISVLPSEIFDILQVNKPCDEVSYQDSFNSQRRNIIPPLPEGSYAKGIRNPGASNIDQSGKHQFTVWSSCGYGYDGYHSYEGPPRNEFNSSYTTLKEANKRAEYVFYYRNPWGFTDEDEIPYPEKDELTEQGSRYLSCQPDDSERWTVSVVRSIAFDFMHH